ncbi:MULTISPECIES: helix-turn-helix transcriptional regulator [unclassified Meridianimarinicoccus]|uniref:helix-turn-helix transcriptional regulator n=1 Tax=unclassified Meridianimarinicoccus TaxID=2923344 RepID=UPI0018692AFB|nr:helix-turn-helix transcriptional regulator [Fluviibacterium sp. MJW13]
MRKVPLVRAAHLNVYLEVLRDLGVPVHKGLDRARLPTTVDETPNYYLSVPLVLDFVSAHGGYGAAMELGFAAAQSMGLEGLRPQTQSAILAAPSGLARVQAAATRAQQENGALFARIYAHGDDLRVVCDIAGFDDSPALAYAEWLQVQAFVSIVRSVAGPFWCPAEMTFISKRAPPAAACEAFPNTRILMGRPHTTILVPRELLGRPCPVDPATLALAKTPPAPGYLATAEMIREILKTYLHDRPLRIGDLAEILGTSERSLQRHLGAQGLKFSQLVAEARYQVACEMLAQHDVSITDVAYSTGYENPSHFSRAFRRFSGVSPRQYQCSLHPHPAERRNIGASANGR